MEINDASVLDMINTLIASHRLNRIQILQIVKLVSISKDINDLKENITWETYKSKYKMNIKNKGSFSIYK